jgi:hypothetical protein
MKTNYILAALLCASCATSPYPDITDESSKELRVSSDDTTLVAMFNRAVSRSNRFVGSDDDPVGPWYESALPNRAAFCMRDISHQCIGEEINGHGRQNLNMMIKFVENISESKDWCSYWEINKYNLPAPVDYQTDKDFWYNLNANFDVLNACYRLFLWTGNRQYIDDERFDRFFRLTLNEYVERWQLEVDKIMQRPAVMNEDLNVEKLRFKDKRGIPSYDEGIPGLHVTSDLLAVIYKAFIAYSEILQLKGDFDASAIYAQKAEAYRQLYDLEWWNPQTQKYYYASIGDSFLEDGGCEMFVPWYGLVKDPVRLKNMLEYISEKEINVEMRTYYPMAYYRHGMNEIAYRYLEGLDSDDRRDYPEVASGMIEGIVSGLAGIEPDAINNIVRTCPRLTDATQWVSVENVPIFSGNVSVLHKSNQKSVFINKTDRDIVWQASFPGDYSKITLDENVAENAKKYTDKLGNMYSYINVTCTVGKTVTAEANNK